MTGFSFIPRYIQWHYGRAFRESYVIWTAFLWFVWRLFAIPLHFRNLFARVSRLGEKYGRGLRVGDRFGAFVVNTLMRLVGFVLRVGVIVSGGCAWVLVALLGLLFFVVWTVYPFLIVVFLLLGFIGLTLGTV